MDKLEFIIYFVKPLMEEARLVLSAKEEARLVLSANERPEVGLLSLLLCITKINNNK